MTEIEITERNQRKENHIAAQPMREWLQKMSQSDFEMTRTQEDLIDHLTNDHGEKINPELEIKRNRKKQLRSRKP